MSEFIQSMRSSVSSAASAYIQFANERPRDEHTIFIFVEDTPDIHVYQHITQVDGACFLGCGGKHGVIEVYEKLLSEGRDQGQCFIVDRDIEDANITLYEQILRTAHYSWETHIVEHTATKTLIQRKSHPNLSTAESAAMADKWMGTVHEFSDLFYLHGALLRVAKPQEMDLKLGSFPITQGSILTKGVLVPGKVAQDWLDQTLQIFIDGGGDEAAVIGLKAQLKRDDVIGRARGKTIFAVWRRFVALSLDSIGRRFLGDLSGSVSVVQMLPSSYASWKYVNEYVSQRLAA